MQVQAYLDFDGRCEEALEFYKTALGARVEMLMRYKDSPEPVAPEMCPPGGDDKVLHSSFRIGESVVMAADGRGGGNPTFRGISLTLNPATEDETRRAFEALASGGQVQMPLGATFFSPSFGIVSDKFGVNWMVMTEPAAAAAG